MLVIRNEQMQAFHTYRLDRLVERLMLLFSTVWPKQTAQLGAGYRHFIESSIVRAMSYGIETESSLARFVNLCLVWGPEFEMKPEHKWAMRILKNSKMRGAIKVNELAFRTRIQLDKDDANGRPLP